MPRRGPTMYAPTKAAQPPTACTIDEPARSINSVGIKSAEFSHPSVFHSQPPAIGYIKPVIITANMANTEYFVRPATAPETMVAHVAANIV